MATVLTTTGATHITQRDTAAPLTHAFDAIILSRGNDVPTTADNRSAVALVDEIASSLTRVATGYPKKGDTDPRNTGASATRWTWRFDVPTGLAGLVASNVVVTNFAAGVPSGTEAILVHGLLDAPLQKLTQERATIFVNVAVGAVAGTGPVVVTAIDEPAVIPALHTYTQRARALATFSSGRAGSRKVTAQHGESVTAFAMLTSSAGGQLAPSMVSAVTLEVRVLDADGRWSTWETDNIGVGSVAPNTVYGDARYPFIGGYNWSHEYEIPDTRDETAYRLVYHVRERGGPSQKFTVEVRTGAEADGAL